MEMKNNEEAFNADNWRNGDLESKGAMVTNLVKRKLLIGLDEAKVINLLGEPNWRVESTFQYLTDIRGTYRDILNIEFEENLVVQVFLSD